MSHDTEVYVMLVKGLGGTCGYGLIDMQTQLFEKQLDLGRLIHC